MKLIDILKEAFESKFTPNNFKILSQEPDGKYMIYKVLVNDEDYTTPSGLKFKIQSIGNIMIGRREKLDWSKYPKFLDFYYIYTDVYYKGKKITKDDGIPGLRQYGWNVNGSINKAKKWLDKNGDKLISGKGYQYKST